MGKSYKSHATNRITDGRWKKIFNRRIRHLPLDVDISQHKKLNNSGTIVIKDDAVEFTKELIAEYRQSELDTYNKNLSRYEKFMRIINGESTIKQEFQLFGDHANFYWEQIIAFYNNGCPEPEKPEYNEDTYYRQWFSKYKAK